MRFFTVVISALVAIGMSGCASKSPRKLLKSDVATGFIWVRNNNRAMDWTTALDYCDNLSYQGESNWRLPGIKELQTIIDLRNMEPASKLGFDMGSKRYWSSTIDAGDNEKAWYVYFKNGGTHSMTQSSKLHALCVRDSIVCKSVPLK